MAVTYDSNITVTALTLFGNSFVDGDHVDAVPLSCSITLHNSSNSPITFLEIGFANSTIGINCIKKMNISSGDDSFVVPANGNITMNNPATRRDGVTYFGDTINFTSNLKNYFSSNPSVDSVLLDCMYIVYASSYGISYVQLPSSFSNTLYAMRSRLKVTANTFNKSIYKIGDTISGTVTLMNQGSFDIGSHSSASGAGSTGVYYGYGRFALGNNELSNPIFEAFDSEKIIPANSSVTFSFSAVAAYTEEMSQYIASHPNERAIAITTIKNKYGYRAFGNNASEIVGYSEITTAPLVTTAAIGGSVFAPSINSFTVTRSINGVPNDEGQELLVSIKLSAAETPLPSSFVLTITDSDGNTIDATSFIPDAMTSTGVVDDGTVITALYNAGNDYSFTLTFGDQYESASATYTISKAFANLHLSGQPTGGACFGGFSASTLNNPMLESYYPIKAYSGIDVTGNMDVTGDISVSGETSLQDKVYVTGGRENMLDENGNSFVGAKYIQGGRFTSFSIPTGTNKSPAGGAISITESGLYLATMFVDWNGTANDTNERLIFISKNSTGFGANTFAYERLFGQRYGELVCNCAGVEYCEAGDTVFFGLHQNSGSTLSGIWGHYYLVKL